MLPKIYAEFCIAGDEMSPDEITQLLGIVPTKSWVKGDPIRAVLKRIESAWHIATQPEYGMEVAKHVEQLLNKLNDKIPLIQDICSRKKLYVMIDCYIKVDKEMPSIYLEPATISKLAQLGAILQIIID